MILYKYWFHAKAAGPATLGEIYTDTIELDGTHDKAEALLLLSKAVSKLGCTLLRYEKARLSKDEALLRRFPDGWDSNYSYKR